ncbi:MAG: hypothetical protein INF12_14690 [Methylobacterium sp.]|nr:hypothetical protein [Methylobacterium sp.]
MNYSDLLPEHQEAWRKIAADFAAERAREWSEKTADLRAENQRLGELLVKERETSNDLRKAILEMKRLYHRIDATQPDDPPRGVWLEK